MPVTLCDIKAWVPILYVYIPSGWPFVCIQSATLYFALRARPISRNPIFEAWRQYLYLVMNMITKTVYTEIFRNVHVCMLNLP